MGQHTKLHLKTDDFYFKIKVQQGGFMKSRKTRLFILAVILMMAFAGCREYATPISNSKNIETTVQAKDHGADIESFFISWNGTVQKFDRSAGTITGILSDIASLAWIAPPGEEMVLTLHPQK